MALSLAITNHMEMWCLWVHSHVLNFSFSQYWYWIVLLISLILLVPPECDICVLRCRCGYLQHVGGAPKNAILSRIRIFCLGAFGSTFTSWKVFFPTHFVIKSRLWRLSRLDARWQILLVGSGAVSLGWNIIQDADVCCLFSFVGSFFLSGQIQYCKNLLWHITHCKKPCGKGLLFQIVYRHTDQPYWLLPLRLWNHTPHTLSRTLVFCLPRQVIPISWTHCTTL